MDIRSGGDYPSNALSNFAPHRFTVRGEACASMEGLIQSLKFENTEMAKHVRSLVGIAAKRKGFNKKWWVTRTLYFQGGAFSRDGDEYQQLLDEAYTALFTQNDGARRALLATASATLTHSLGKRKPTETILTVSEYCGRLTKIRAGLKNGTIKPLP